MLSVIFRITLFCNNGILFALCVLVVLQPQREPPLESPVGTARNRREARLSIAATTARRRVPWTEEEVKHLEAAVSALGIGKWKKALSLYKFQDCRTAVDLKDKWCNITK